MLIGLKNAPATVETAMDDIQSLVEWQSELLYCDDLVVFLRSASMYMAHLRQLLTLLWKASVTLVLKKCSLSSETIN